MKTLGLTGGLGMGKSTAAEWLGARGVAVVDTDLLARQVVAPGQPALAEIQQQFGDEVVGPDGSLRREVLARIVFADAAARKRLEEITHPRIGQLWRAQLQAWREEARPRAVVVIPLLFETGAGKEFAATVCVGCSAWSQRQRLLARGWTAEQIELRLRAQWPLGEKMDRADFGVWTEGDRKWLGVQLDRILAGL